MDLAQTFEGSRGKRLYVSEMDLNNKYRIRRATRLTTRFGPTVVLTIRMQGPPRPKYSCLGDIVTSLRTSNLTQNWTHSTIFEKLIISYWKCTYATSCSYLLSHPSGILPVSISWLMMTSYACADNSTVRDVSRLWHFPTQQLYVSKRLSSCSSPATHAGFVQRALHRSFRVKTFGRPRSFPLSYSHRGFSVTHCIHSFFNFHFPHILTLVHRKRYG